MDQQYKALFRKSQISKVKSALLKKKLYPSTASVERHVDISIEVFTKQYTSIALERIKENYLEDLMPAESELLQEAESALLGNYYENEEAYGYCIKEGAVDSIISEMVAKGTEKDS